MTPAIAVTCGVAAFATRRLDQATVTHLRRQPGSFRGTALPANLLRHSDEQTVAALAAILTAVESFPLPGDFSHWGVVAAPRFVGRPAVTQTIARFLSEGAWGVSPHVIPHRSPHSVSGTLSQALALHGPNFAAGGEAEALLCAAALLHDGVPGVWVVLSRLTPETDCDPSTGRPAAEVEAHAVALALTPVADLTLELEIVRGESLSLATLDELLARFLSGEDVEQRPEDHGRVALRHAGGRR